MSHRHTGSHSWSGIRALRLEAVAHPPAAPPAPTMAEPSPSHPPARPPTALFPSLWWFLAPGLLVPAGPRLETACLLFALRVWPLCYQRLWDFSGGQGGEESSPVWPQGVAATWKEAGSQTLIMLSWVYVQWPEAEMLGGSLGLSGARLFSTFEASQSAVQAKSARPGVKQTDNDPGCERQGRGARLAPAPNRQGSAARAPFLL